jgi:hypothetical protein
VSDALSTTTGPVWTFTTPAGQQLITKMSVSSIEEAEQDLSQSRSRVQIFPNPADKSFQIRVSDLNTKKILVSIYDMNGKLYLQKQYGSTNGIIIDDHLNPGVYIVKVVSDNFTENRKLVIK